MRKVLLLMAGWLLSMTAWGQAGKFFDIDHLRSGLFINQLYIDRNGFLWAVTSNGIVQYDGYQFQTFKRGQKNAAGMAGNHVLCMAQAAELLACGKMNVSEVTYTCGFSSPTSFSALFKKFYGVAPSLYYKSKME